MPRRVDHEERRAAISEALVSVAARDGLHAVTMRSVAKEAGVSLRLVQYYFQTKAQLMISALGYMERRSKRRWRERLEQLPGQPTARSYLEAFVAEALPRDIESRQFHTIFTAYAALSITDDTFAEQPFLAGTDRLEAELSDILHRAQKEGELSSALDLPFEVATILALNHGLGTSVAIGQKTLEDAERIFHYHLDRIFEVA